MPTRHHLGTICFASALAPNSWMPGPSLLLALQLKLGSRRHTRPLERRLKLAAAIKAARKHKGPVIVSKLDRLSRDVHFISGLMADRVPFIVTELLRTWTRSCCTCLPRWRRRNGR